MKRTNDAKRGEPKIALPVTANAANPHANIPGVNFSRIKSSYLEGALKLTNAEIVKQKLKRKNDELKNMAIGGDIPLVPCLDRVLSVQSISSDHELGGEDTKELKHFEEFEIVLREVLNEEEGVDSSEVEVDNSSCPVENAAPSNEEPFVSDIMPSERDNGDGEKIECEQINEGEKGNVYHFFNKTKEAYKSLNLDKLFLVNRFNNSLRDEDVEKRKGNEGCENAHSKNEEKHSLMKTIERKLKSQNSFVMENIYNAFRGTINDFIDVYLQGEDEDTDEGKSKGTVMRKNTKILSVHPFRHGERVNLSDEHDLKKMYQMDNDIFLSGGEKGKNKVGKSGYGKRMEEDTNVKKYLSQFGDKRNLLKLGDTNSHYSSRGCKIKMGGAKLFGESNVVADSMAYLGVSLSKQKTHILQTNMEKHKQMEEAYSAYYPEAEKFEYSSIISEYLYNQKGLRRREKDDGRKLSSDHNCTNRNGMKYELHPSMGNQMSNVLDTQVNDRNVFDIAPMTQKYKYASNIILTINKIKNVERVVEINLSITDVELKIPGMRIENVILPYKYASDFLTIKIKTLSEENEGMSKKVKYRGGDLNGHHFGEHETKREDTEEKKVTIKCYFVFIPLSHIKEEVVNKRLILISSKRKEEFEKDGLLPDTLYMIESQNLNCEKQKHMYVSVKVCKSGVHFFPRVNAHKADTLHMNYTTSEDVTRNAFEPVYVCLYNDEVDREIGNILNGKGLAMKVRINKLATEGHYMVNNLPVQFYFNNSNMLLCSHGDITEEAENMFNNIGKEFISVESFIDFFPTIIFPPVEDVLFLDFIKRNELLQLKFVLHFLAITEIICVHLCSLFGFHVEIKPLFRDHLNAVEMDDGMGERSHFTFLYTSYEEDTQPKGYFLNYTKPFVFRFQGDNKCNNAEGEKSTQWDENDLFIMDYARKQAIFIHNVIKHHREIHNIPRCYDRKKRILFTTDRRKKQFQIYYLNILRRYNSLLNNRVNQVTVNPGGNEQTYQWGSQTDFVWNGNNSKDEEIYRGDKCQIHSHVRDHSSFKLSTPVRRQGGANRNAPNGTNKANGANGKNATEAPNTRVCDNRVEEKKSRSHLEVSKWEEKMRGENVDSGNGALQGKPPKVENAYRRNVTVTGQAKIAEERSFAGGKKTTGEEQKLSMREEITGNGEITNEKTSFYNLREYKNYHFHGKKEGKIIGENGNSFEDLDLQLDRGRDGHEEINTNGWHVNTKGKVSSVGGMSYHDDEVSYYNVHREDIPFSLESVKWDFNEDDVYPSEHPVYGNCSNGYGKKVGVSASSEGTPGGDAEVDGKTISIAQVSYGRGYNAECSERNNENYANRLPLGRDARLSFERDQNWIASKLSASKVCIDHTEHAGKHCKLVRRSDNEA
ncbi:conserved Plasmodium protein, unknown function [Plasmodium knowlesi strain H]|uniref:Uncharacterized protein n=3 Tax=Plasmodium knowlesi TaxID=5850 RepID=A0A5K1UBE3_PLAKH|nr:conserved Plasmodium protein, unknown function [Plasmodium knowlesi strain H]OTN64568.1 Uncharacterized protein PKNOH_S130194600 [Plasmodium knowlesi]CAA9989109.1 conserved Plasmodium protein, unknown function [Plasmodium knowlesi strain H]SBO27324.1 conserved Plasmodium protein, unknown function [Plasmodium knowlesi strain H]SBO28948.1 conserved Plasmodium protein, unknown function [Plasmodium knowlesi strain H]VVS78583.1 conserved Plasmodium protein, unknown function [Plasmodium knowlesi |eukprot:XP_002261456.1 hypothetical protein, conserved in Plasmodium species [Plasmodium knowlesi strain H]